MAIVPLREAKVALAAGRCLLFGIAAATGTPACAQVTGVITDSEATVQMQPGQKPGDSGLYRFDGAQIQGSVGSNAFGSGGTFASTSRLDPDGVDFQNGNASGGRYAFTSSHTAIDISFTNDDAVALIPSLRSSILPAGLGLFIDHPCLDDVAACGPGHSLFSIKDFRKFAPDTLPGPANDIAGASFNFSVRSGGTVIYSLTASVVLAYDPMTHGNVLITDFGAAEAALSGFRLSALPGDASQFGVVWDATNFEVSAPGGALLQPGDSAVFTYESTVETFSRTPCYAMNAAACVVAYSSFGDPVGRGGGIIPGALLGSPGQFSAEDAQEGGGLQFATFGFKHPVYRDGVVSFDMDLPPVPEPSTWSMLIAGFGLVGLTLRRGQSRVGYVV